MFSCCVSSAKCSQLSCHCCCRAVLLVGLLIPRLSSLVCRLSLSVPLIDSSAFVAASASVAACCLFLSW